MNKITEISRNEINKVIEETKARDGFLVELDGKIISTEKDYVLAMREKMEIPVEFPNPVLGWLNDYLCDLSWMDNNCITIIIWNYNNFLNESLKKKMMYF
ncbi:hypothetical protein [Butyrivibrio sp. INlla14]|uniref:hypothetical protein n=1 Tax=Butyrivibrio sp. INlla14 TaxID=1520808 RepID=UPI0008764543|nr:hypothetical protein [Butyrivibrio sp. INlla14]SCY73379.1 hypothetical protein SAMN02910371_03640 [Butyrivibrio sp. INlla14]